MTCFLLAWFFKVRFGVTVGIRVEFGVWVWVVLSIRLGVELWFLLVEVQWSLAVKCALGLDCNLGVEVGRQVGSVVGVGVRLREKKGFRHE